MPCLGLLGRHIVDASQNLTSFCQGILSIQLLRQSKVGDSHFAVIIDHDIGRLQVTMQHAAGMDVVNCFGDGLRNLRRTNKLQLEINELNQINKLL